jgi:hypothetical protein
MSCFIHSKTVIYVALFIAFLASFNVYIGVQQTATERQGITTTSTPSLLRQENNNVKQTGIVTVTDAATTSAAASRLERMEMYQKRYKYLPPSPYFNHTERDVLCGTSPTFKKFFSMIDRRRPQRSANNEDNTIYNLFFKDDNGKGIKGSVVEMGAYNGLQESNSRFFDVCLGWETMLVEGNPLLWDQVVSNRPHAHRFSYAPSCSEEDEIANTTVKFDSYPMTNGGLADGSVTTAYTFKNHTVDVPCGSLTKVLLDIFPNGHVSFFSLDVEGAEPLVVGNIDFDKVFIEVMMIENRNNFCEAKCESRDKFRKIMQDAGYERFNPAVKKSDLFIHPLSKHLQTMKKMYKQ